MRRSTGEPRFPLALTVVAIVTCGCAGVFVPAMAQLPTSAPPVILTQPLSVRSAGMNGAGAALVGNAGAVFSNPAGIATIRHVGIEGTYRTLPPEESLASGALAWRLRQFDVGFGIAQLSSGRDLVSNFIPGLANATELMGLGSLVYRFGIIAVAGSGKYLQRVVDDSHESATSADVGLAVALFDIAAIGFSMQNIGGRWSGASSIAMPGLTRLAMMWNYVDPLETFRLLSTVELQWPEGEEVRAVVGAEGGIVVHGIGLLGRTAYGTASENSIFSRVSYGGSLAVARIALDYAYQRANLGGESVHRFGFRLSL